VTSLPSPDWVVLPSLSWNGHFNKTTKVSQGHQRSKAKQHAAVHPHKIPHHHNWRIGIRNTLSAVRNSLKRATATMVLTMVCKGETSCCCVHNHPGTGHTHPLEDIAVTPRPWSLWLSPATLGITEQPLRRHIPTYYRWHTLEVLP